MSIRFQGVLAASAGLAISLPAAAQSIPWLTATTGNWSDTTKWTGGNVPDAMGESAVLGLTGAYTVTQNVAGLMLDAIDITNTDAVLNLGGRAVTLLGTGIANSGTIVNNAETGTISGLISNGATGRINVNSSTALNLDTSLVNDGLFTVNTSGGSSTTTLTIQAPLTIGGSGSLVLNNTTSRAQIIASGSGALTNGASHTIRGLGQITAPMTNNGTVSATVAGQSLFLSLTDKTNNGLMRGAGGTLDIVSITITQGASGVIRGEETLATLSSSSILGGSIDSTGAGRIRTVAGTSVLSNVDSTADVEVASGTGLALSGGYTNDGTLLVNLSGGASTTSLRIDGPVTIDGTGTIRLNNTTSRGQIIAGTDGVLTLGAGQLVHGRGQISVGGTNNGIISADVAANELLLNIAAKENNGLMEAAGGILGIVGITVTQGASGEVLADGSEVQLNNATIVGGEIASSGAGRVRTVGGTNAFSGVDSTADVEVNSGTALALAGGSYTNNGSLTVNPVGGASTTSLRIDGPLTIDGTGEIRLGSTTLRGQIIAGVDGSLILGPGQTLGGIGQVALPTTIQGAVAPGLSVGTLTVNAPGTPLTWSPGSSLEIEIDTLASFDRITSGSHTINGGTVDVTITGAYTPALFDTFTVIDGAASSVVTGRFDGVNGPALPAPWIWKVGTSGNDVLVGVSCPSDVNTDFLVDILDFLDFIDDFAACEQEPGPCGAVINADFNGDTFVDILDFLDFIDAFGSGC